MRSINVRYLLYLLLPPDWKRQAGRPIHTWLRAIEADLGPLNFGFATAWRKATTRDELRRDSRRMATYCGHSNAPTAVRSERRRKKNVLGGERNYSGGGTAREEYDPGEIFRKKCPTLVATNIVFPPRSTRWCQLKAQRLLPDRVDWQSPPAIQWHAHVRWINTPRNEVKIYGRFP